MNPKRLFSALMVVMSVATTAAASDAIERKYKDVGAATLGKPAGAEKSSAGGGRVRLYANGGIWSSKTAGTHVVYGPAFDKYKSLRAERGELGYPVTDVTKLPDGSAQALFRHGYLVIDASGAVRSEVIPKATFTADSITPEELIPTEAAKQLPELAGKDALTRREKNLGDSRYDFVFHSSAGRDLVFAVGFERAKKA